ncbi:MAG: hypothetical protein AB8G23_21820 [Myxococcota bacterium]
MASPAAASSAVQSAPAPEEAVSEAEGALRSNLRSTKSDALEALLVDLGPQVRRNLGQSADLRNAPNPGNGLGGSEDWDPTGIPALDARLGGGFPRGRLSEICGPASSGRTSLALSLLAETLARGVLAAWIDLADAFDPASATASLRAHSSEVDLNHLLWVRARTEEEALRSCDRLLQTEGFELLIFDLPLYLPGSSSASLSSPPSSPPSSRTRKKRAEIRDVSWLRLARLAGRTRTTLLVISERPRARGNEITQAVTGSRADLVLEMQPQGARFMGSPPLLDTLETNAVLRRHRRRPIGQEVSLSLDADSER